MKEDMSSRIAVVDGLRLPFVKAGGVLKNTTAVELGVAITSELIARYPFVKNTIDEVIVGNVAQPADSANVARVISLQSNIDKSIPAYTVHRNCASGMEAVSQAMLKIRAKEGEIYYSLGVESMSNAPFLFHKSTQNLFEELFKAKTVSQKYKLFTKFRPKHFIPEIGIKLGLTDPVCNMLMGVTAENIAQDFAISRKEQDEFACRSHNLAEKATNDGVFAEEISMIFSKDTNKIISQDDGIRKSQTIDALAKLKPFFVKGSGTVTVGNSSQITDGACGLILASEHMVKKLGIKPLGYIKDATYTGCDNTRMGLGPVFSTQKLLHKHKMQLQDFDLLEINEAFAAQVLGCVRAMDSQSFFDQNFNGVKKLGEINMDCLNINGGAIALGHPVGATGARLVLHSLKEMQRKNMQTGLASLCIGGGQGATFILENK